MEGESLLKYSDAEDKCFGVVGMAIGMVVFNAEQYMSGINLERNNMDSLEFYPEFDFAPSSSLSPKTVWNHLLKRFNITSGLLISNVMCRYYVHRHIGFDSKVRTEMLNWLKEEGDSVCQLESDEIETLFNKNCDYLSRAFLSRNVASIACDMAASLADRRRMSHSEIMAYLSSEDY